MLCRSPWEASPFLREQLGSRGELRAGERKEGSWMEGMGGEDEDGGKTVVWM